LSIKCFVHIVKGNKLLTVVFIEKYLDTCLNFQLHRATCNSVTCLSCLAVVTVMHIQYKVKLKSPKDMKTFCSKEDHN